MPEWLRDAVTAGEPLPPTSVLIGRVALAVVCGFLVAGVYTWTLGRRGEDGRTLRTTLVLLSVLIAVVTLVIGNSVARAFGLVGALSIVRFRTVVEDTRDTAFVIFAVAVGMAAGPAAGLEIVDRLAGEPALRGYHLLPSVRGDLLAKLGRTSEARDEFQRAASLTQNARERALLLERACRVPPEEDEP